MNREEDIEFLKEFKEKVNEYLFLGYAPCEGLFSESEDMKKMREALKDRKFVTVHNAIYEMKPRVEKLLKEYNVDFMWEGTYPGSMRFPLFDLITENETYTNISKEVFLDRIDEAIGAMLRAAGRGLILISMSQDRDPHQEEVYEAIKKMAQESGLSVQLVNDLKEEGTMDRVLESIKFCEFFVVDLTYAEAKVYFEAGYAQGIRQDVLYIVQSGVNTEIDLKDPIFFHSVHDLGRKLDERIRRLREQKE